MSVRLHPFIFKIFKDGKLSYFVGTLKGVRSFGGFIVEMRYNKNIHESENGIEEYYDNLEICKKFKKTL